MGTLVQSLNTLSQQYFLTILDNYSDSTWIVLLKSKGEVQSHVQNFVHLIENQFEISVKIIRFSLNFS